MTTCVLLLAAFPGEAAIVNSLEGAFSTERGWAGGLEGAFSASGGNTEETSLEAGGRVEWRGESETWRLFGSAKRSSSGGVETARAVTGHLRHNHRLSGRWATVAFLQVQENPFQLLESRFLAGAGLRWDAVRGEKRRLSLGATHMHERQKLEGLAAESLQRLSLFFVAAWEVREGIVCSGSGFFQPAWADFDDWRTMAEADLEVKLAERLALFSGLSLEGNSRPAQNVEKVDWSTKTGLRWKF